MRCASTKGRNIHSAKELETFIIFFLLCSGQWEIFPLHKNRNTCTFIEYSISSYILDISIQSQKKKKKKKGQFEGDGTLFFSAAVAVVGRNDGVGGGGGSGATRSSRSSLGSERVELKALSSASLTH